MSKIQKYYNLNGTDVNVYCTNGSVTKGYWSEIFSAEDNEYLAIENGREPPGESILIDTPDEIPVEIYVNEIERIETA